MIVADGVLNGRIYRAAFLPLLFALAIAGFSLSDRPAPLSSSLAPGAFEGSAAFADLQGLAARFPDRRPGGRGDDELAGYVARVLRSFGGSAGGGFAVQVRSQRAQTIAGERTLQTVIAQRPGTTGEPPIVIVAHRDAGQAGARAELSGTAVLLELARVFAASETQRTIVLVCTSGGSGGNAGAAAYAAYAAARPGGQGDAAIVLGDLAGARASRPFVTGLSDVPGAAPVLLQRTVVQAIAQQTGAQPGTPTIGAELAQLVFPLTLGEQGPLNAGGLPAVLVQVGSELPPPADEPVSAARLQALGRSVLAAVYALDAGPEMASTGSEMALPVQRKLLPEWALRLIVATLLLPPLLVIGDGVARVRRRRRAQSAPTETSLARWLAWTLACGLPFLAGALCAILLGGLGVIAAPRPPVASAALPLTGQALEAVLAVGLVLVLGWLVWPALMRRASLPVLPGARDAGLAVVLVLGALAVVVWVVDPFTALLLVPALHLWLVIADSPPAGSRLARRPALWSLALVAGGLVPLALLVTFYVARLGLDFGGVLHTALLLFAGGRVGVSGALLWSVAAGVLAAALLVALAPAEEAAARVGGYDDGEILTELPPMRAAGAGSKSFYAGPGSLGGTESALRR
jgi:Peptidase family M28